MLMRPLRNCSMMSEDDKIYNLLFNVQRIVENTFGILARRWRIFLKLNEMPPETVSVIVLDTTCRCNMWQNTITNISNFGIHCEWEMTTCMLLPTHSKKFQQEDSPNSTSKTTSVLNMVVLDEAFYSKR